MFIGTIREQKLGESRVGLIPEGARLLAEVGHSIFVETGAGAKSGFGDGEYQKVGATILGTAEEVTSVVDILVKVKEPVEAEYNILKELKGKTLFTFLHLSGSSRLLTEQLLLHNITAIAYETVEDASGGLPLLKPMSKIAGCLAIDYGMAYLKKGITEASVVIVGGGAVGEAAAIKAVALGARVVLFDTANTRVQDLKQLFQTRGEFDIGVICVLQPEEPRYSQSIQNTDLLVGAVHKPGMRAPEVVSEEQVQSMKKGTVIVDVSADQGGCVFGSRPTTHDNPVFTDENGHIYCCVTNMPGKVPAESTPALAKATLPYLIAMANSGTVAALKKDPHFRQGLNVYAGKITCKAVAEHFDMQEHYNSPEEVLGLNLIHDFE